MVVPAFSKPPKDVVATVSEALVLANGCGATVSRLACWLSFTGILGMLRARPLLSVCRARMSTRKSPGFRIRPLNPLPVGATAPDGTNYDSTLFGYDNSGRRW